MAKTHTQEQRQKNRHSHPNRVKATFTTNTELPFTTGNVEILCGTSFWHSSGKHLHTNTYPNTDIVRHIYDKFMNELIKLTRLKMGIQASAPMETK